MITIPLYEVFSRVSSVKPLGSKICTDVDSIRKLRLKKRKTGKNQPVRKTKQQRRWQERADRRHDRRRQERVESRNDKGRQERVEEVNTKTGKSRKRRDTEIRSEARQRQEEVERRQEREKRKQQNDKIRVRKDKAEVRQGYSLSGLTLQDNLRVHNVHSGFFNLDAVDQFTAV